MWTVIDDMLNKFHTVIAWTAMFTYQNIIRVSTVFLPGFSTLGSTRPMEMIKGVMREKSGSQFLDTVDSTFTSQLWVRVNTSYFLR